MASCDTCVRPVMNDGQRCERCQVVGRRRELNLIGEFVAYGWSVSTSLTAPMRLSVAHLIPVEQARLTRGGTAAAWDGPAVCGVEKRARTARVDHAGSVAGEAIRGERSWCRRCFAIVAQQRLHVPKYRTHRTGVGNRYGRGASGSGGRNTHVECSCGWTNAGNATKREQEENFRDHLRDVMDDGLFRVKEDRYPERVVGLWSAVAAFEGTPITEATLRGMVFGEGAGGPVPRRGYTKVKRVAMPLIPRRSS